MALVRRSRHGLMSPLASHAAPAAKFDNTLRGQNRPCRLRRTSASVGEENSNLSVQTDLEFAIIGEPRSSEHRTGREFYALRLTDVVYSLLKAIGMPQTRSRSRQKEIS